MKIISNNHNPSITNDTFLEIAKESPIYPRCNFTFFIYSLTAIGGSKALRDIYRNRIRFMKNPIANAALLAYGLFWPCVIGKECWSINKYLKIAKKVDQIHHQKVAVIFQSDNLGAFSRSLTKRYYLFSNLSKAGYQPVFKKISVKNINETVRILKNQKNAIEVLWLNVHGDCNGLKPSDKESIEGWHFDPQFLSSINQLETTGTVVLESCDTANKNYALFPFAEKLFCYVPRGVKIIAAEDKLSQFGTYFVKHRPLEVEFHRRFWFKDYWVHGSNITRIYQNKIIGSKYH